MKKTVIICILFVSVLQVFGNTYYYKNNKKVGLSLKKVVSRATTNIDYYVNEYGIELGITDKLIVKTKNKKTLIIYLDEFNLSIEKELSKDLYLLKTMDKNLTINIANKLNEKNTILYAHPDFIKKRMMR
ncbi:hypothetical protein JHD49_06050 [Sulfurimonas sp. SAG-AH-194-C21]|nr:hypothetical protein [Sulfurimonas sp. SAG-AH-194-C21]MDF1883500.1 hypothetical protein [Sulfurimonas sp. SAG-AH-194-C21]